MKQLLTEIIFILDRSGSMQGLEADTVGGYREILKKQRAYEGETRITTVLFDHEYDLIFDGVPLEDAELTEEQYFARGGTALLDAVGKTILDVRRRIEKTPKQKQPDQVLVVITTDGYENSSKEFGYRQVRALIEEQKRKARWEFLFLGANIDAAGEAEKIGIDRSYAHAFEATRGGVNREMSITIPEFLMEHRERPKSKK